MASAEAHIQQSTAIADQRKNPSPTLHNITTLRPLPRPLGLDSRQVTTPIQLEKLKHFIAGQADKKFIITGFQVGFRLGYIGPRQASRCTNLKSCLESPDIVASKLTKEINASRIKGPFAQPPFPNLKVSPIGVVPKKTPGQFRLIHHLSHPSGDSVNDFIDPALSTVRYASFDDAVALLLRVGCSSLLAKTDIDNAFRLIPIHPDDHALLGMTFRDQFYYDTCLPMGASSSCAIFEKFSSSLEWIANSHLNIPYIVHILDDFLIIGPPNSSQCFDNLKMFLAFCKYVGIPIKEEKTVYPCKIITFMGLELDSVSMEARLPPDKLEKLLNLLEHNKRKRKIKLRELQSLLGLLNFCCQVVVPGRSFMRRLTDLTCKVTNPNHHITLNRESRKDLNAWCVFVQHFNGRQLLLERRWITSDMLHLHTDSSGAIGFAAVFGSKWFNGKWSAQLLPLHITFKELFPIVIALELWGVWFRDNCLTIHSDNSAVVHIINKQSSKEPMVMTLVRRLVLVCMSKNILVRAKHIPGKLNILPDLLSRFQMEQFHLHAPQMDPEPTEVPEELIQLS